MVDPRYSRDDSSPRLGPSYERAERQKQKAFHNSIDEKYQAPSGIYREYQEKPDYEDRASEDYRYNQNKEYRYRRNDDYLPMMYERASSAERSPIMEQSPSQTRKENTARDRRMYNQPFPGRQFRSNSISGGSLLSIGQEIERDKMLGFHSPPIHTAHNSPTEPSLSSMDNHPLERQKSSAALSSLRFFRKEQIEDSGESEDDSSKPTKGRKKIRMDFIKDKGRRGVTFSKRKKGIMKKAYELNVLTKCEILLVVASETGHVYTFATPKLQPIIKQHENLIQQYLNTPYTNDVNRIYDTPERFPQDSAGYYKNNDTYGYDRIIRGNAYPPGYYQNGYDGDSSPENGPRL
ncbi:hypothetical protein NEIG_01952 [Nematocida sp. ERTm5]|nr:hypothetical protein NEIG_01952 [Nematocida sp. ERTm5]